MKIILLLMGIQLSLLAHVMLGPVFVNFAAISDLIILMAFLLSCFTFYSLGGSVLSCLVLYCIVLSCLVLSYVLTNTPMESNGQGWGAWSSLAEMC